MLSKPRITGMVMLATAVGYILASRLSVDWLHLAGTLLGTLMVGAGGNSLNQYMERETDKLMARTRRRPLPAGRFHPWLVLVLGGLTSVGGALLLALWANLLAGLIGLGVILLYVFCYTPLKRISGLNTLVGAVPGALPPVLGWAAATGSIEPGAAAIFMIMFIWQPPHFLSIAYLYREDYRQAGMPMLTVIDAAGAARRQLILYTVILIPVGMYPSVIGMTGQIYFFGSLALGLLFLAAAAGMALQTSRFRARILLKISIIYLPMLFGLMIYDARLEFQFS